MDELIGVTARAAGDPGDPGDGGGGGGSSADADADDARTINRLSYVPSE